MPGLEWKSKISEIASIPSLIITNNGDRACHDESYLHYLHSSHQNVDI